MTRFAGFPRLARAALLVAVLGAGTLTACSSAASGSGFTFSSATTIGTVVPAADRKKAEDVTADLLTGGTTSLRHYAGHVLVVNFWASWCGPCQTETPQFDAMYRQIHPKGIDVLGINTKDQASKAKQFVKDNDITFPVVFDEDGKVLLQLGNIPSGGLPITVLIDKQQRVAAVYVADLSPKDVEPALNKLNAES